MAPLPSPYAHRPPTLFTLWVPRTFTFVPSGIVISVSTCHSPTRFFSHSCSFTGNVPIVSCVSVLTGFLLWFSGGRFPRSFPPTYFQGRHGAFDGSVLIA